MHCDEGTPAKASTITAYSSTPSLIVATRCGAGCITAALWLRSPPLLSISPAVLGANEPLGQSNVTSRSWGANAFRQPIKHCWGAKTVKPLNQSLLGCQCLPAVHSDNRFAVDCLTV
eukprot:847249-Prorocentrum_minimum.AAC.1